MNNVNLVIIKSVPLFLNNILCNMTLIHVCIYNLLSCVYVRLRVARSILVIKQL
jgi:hypothetical protein